MESDLCCLCGVHVDRNRGRIIVEQSKEIISLICEWIAPRVVSENDYICQSCYKHFPQAFEKARVSNMKESKVGLDMEVFEDCEQSFNGECSKTPDKCVVCDTLLSTRQRLLIIKQDPTELEQLMLNIISEAISPEIQIGREDKVCPKCWYRVRRSAINLQHINESELNGIEDGNQSVEIKSESESDHEHFEYLTQNGDKDSESIERESEETGNSSEIDESDLTINPVSDKKEQNNSYEYLSDLDPHINELKDDLNADPDFILKIPIQKKIQKKKQKKEQTQDGTELNSLASDEIVLPNYKRAGSTRHYCVLPKCKNQQLRRINNEMRIKLINDYKFYAPQSARMCNEHLLSCDWNILQETGHLARSTNLKFNANHIEDMFSMVQDKKGIDIDFSNVLKLDDSIIKYLLGTTRDILTSIITREPQILSKSNGIKALLALFIKHENGSSKTRISEFLKLPRNTLCNAIKDIQEILSNSPVTKELGLEHILLNVKIN